MKRTFGFYLMLFVVAATLGASAQDQSSSAPPQQQPSQTESQPAQTQPSQAQQEQPLPEQAQPPSSAGSSSSSSITPRSMTTPTTPAEGPPVAQQEGPKPQYVQVTPGQGNQLKPLDFLGTAVPESNLSLGLNAQVGYDTNIAGFSRTRQSQASWLLGPHLGISQYRAKLGLNLSYDGGLGIYNQISNGNSYSQTVSADVLYQITSHWQAHAGDHFTYTSNPFGSYYTITGTPTPDHPSPNIYVPFVVSNQNQVELDLADQINRYDTITFNGSEYYQRFSNYAQSGVYAGGGLYNNISFSGGANYSHRFSAKLSAGGGYEWTSLDFSHGAQRSGISAFSAFINYQLNKSFSISGFAGPEHITAKTVIPVGFQYYILKQAHWVPSFGLNLGWQGLRNAASLGLSRQVSNGGGLLATTTVYSVNGSWHRKLSARWDGTLFATYSNNASFAASQLNRQFFPVRKFTLLTAGLTFDRPITQRVVAHLSYAYTYETQKAIYLPPAIGTYNDSRVSLQIQYILNKPLGR
jgi:hypothetical protein